jgi:plasmid stabilization system protein ParE
MNVVHLQAAQRELDEAFEWYEAQRSGLGNAFIDEINATVRRIRRNPEAYARVERDIRRALVKRFPYGVMYGYDPAAKLIVVVAIAHLHRKPGYWANIGPE